MNFPKREDNPDLSSPSGCKQVLELGNIEILRIFNTAIGQVCRNPPHSAHHSEAVFPMEPAADETCWPAGVVQIIWMIQSSTRDEELDDNLDGPRDGCWRLKYGEKKLQLAQDA